MEEENKGKEYGGVREEWKSWIFFSSGKRRRDYC